MMTKLLPNERLDDLQIKQLSHKNKRHENKYK